MAEPSAAPASVSWWRIDADLPCPAPRRQVHVQRLDDEALFADPATQTTYRLNRTALAFWQRLDPGRTTRAVAQDVADEYDVDVDRVLEDLEQTLAFFAAHDLVA